MSEDRDPPRQDDMMIDISHHHLQIMNTARNLYLQHNPHGSVLLTIHTVPGFSDQNVPAVSGHVQT